MAAISSRALSHTNGASTSEASVKRHAAIASDGTPSACAQRIKIDAVETISTPPASTAYTGQSVERIGTRLGRASPEQLDQVLEGLNEIIAA